MPSFAHLSYDHTIGEEFAAPRLSAINKRFSDANQSPDTLQVLKTLFGARQGRVPSLRAVYTVSLTSGIQKSEGGEHSIFGNVLRDLSSANTENAVNEARLLRFRRDFSQSLISALEQEFIEPGVVSTADGIVSGAIRSNRRVALTWINDLFIKYFARPDLASGLLLIAGRLPYKDAYPNGPTMAIAGLSHSSAEVQEAAVRAFEHWATAESLELLENVQTPHVWLDEYIDEVKRDIRERLCTLPEK